VQELEKATVTLATREAELQRALETVAAVEAEYG
jgi:hypothetical protein